MSAQTMIDRILSDARSDAERIVAEAEREAAEILAESREQERRLREERAGERMLSEREDAARIEAMAESEYRFSVLKTRQELAEAAFSRAVAMLSELPRETSEALWGTLLAKYAGDGDEVVLSAHEGTLDAGFVASASVRCGKSVALSSARGTFSGGMILRSAYCDKNLTAEMLVREFREQRETEVFRMLFPEASRGESRGEIRNENSGELRGEEKRA